MNIYKTKDGQYINMNMVQYIEKDYDDSVEIWFEMKDKIKLYEDQAKAFLEYLDNHLEGVYAGSA
jgi:hypothetical protein